MVRLPRGSKKVDEGNGVALFELPPHPRTGFPLWRIDKLEEDIERCERSIEQFQAHIDDQRKVIEERRQQIIVCQQRDAAIAKWEAERADSDFPPGE
jgi:multidrug resistance efflux pump